MTPAATATKTKRAQVIPKPNYRSIDDVNEGLRQLCDIESRIDARTAEFNLQVTDLKATFDEEIKEDLETQARIKRDMEDYCTYYRDSIFPKDKKSIELAHGEVNFREHPAAIKVKKTIQIAIERIKEIYGKAADDYLRTKVELNKEALVKLPETDLEKLQLKLEQKETFGYKLNLQSLAPASSQSARVGNA